MPKTLQTLLSAASVLTLVNGSAKAEPQQRSETYRNWAVHCTEREDVPPCDMVQVTTQKDNDEQAVQFSIADTGEKDLYGVQLKVPLGVLLASDAVIRIDREPNLVDLKFTRCEAMECFLETVMRGDELGRFQSGDKGIVALFGRFGEPLIMPLSFDGFDEALKAMTADNQNWADNS